MPQENFAKQMERPSYIFTFTAMVAYSLILFLKYPDMVNPTPISPWCTWDSYPHGCADNANELVCLRGNSKDQKVLVFMILPPLAISFLILLVTMTMILYNHSKHLRALRKARKEHNSDMHCEIEERMQLAIVEEASTTSKKVTSQAIAYILSFLLTWIFLVLKLALKDMDDLRSLDVLRLIFQPSQGVFHLIIFLWQKVDAVRRCNPDLEFSTTKILMVIICHPNELEEDRPISNLVELLKPGTDSYISSVLPADANLPITSSDLGFRIYKDIKMPPKLMKSRELKKESDHEDSSFFNQQEESIDSLFLHTSLSLARIPEDVESSTGFQDLSVGEYNSLNSRSLRMKASDVDIGENDHEENEAKTKDYCHQD